MNPPHCPAPGGAPKRHSPREGVAERDGPPPRAKAPAWPWLLLAALLPLAWRCMDALLVVLPPESESSAPLATAPDAGTVPAFTDTSPDGVLASQAGRPVPREPERWQKTTRCLDDVEERLLGACYIRAARKPPCPPALFEHAGACFVAVAKSRRPDTSVDEVP